MVGEKAYLRVPFSTKGRMTQLGGQFPVKFSATLATSNAEVVNDSQRRLVYK